MSARRWLLASLLAAPLTAPLAAATRCVKPPPSGACAATITDAVNAAAAGDTILVYPGVYRESVAIPALKDGLRIVGSGVAVIDPEALTGGSAAAITVASPGVTLTNLTVRNGGGDGIVVSASGAKMSYLKFIGPDGNCVTLAPGADGTSITRSRLQACGGDGVRFGDNLPTKVSNVSVATTTFVGLDGWGIHGWGDALAVTGNTFLDMYEESVDVALGDNAVIKSNVIKSTGCSTAGIHVVGSGANVSLNRLTDVACYGIELQGANATVVSNTLTVIYGDGIHVDGATPTVRYNVLTAVDGDNIIVLNGGSAATVSYNRIAGDTGSDLIDVTADNAMVVGNVMNVGYEGIHVTGDNPTILSNAMTNMQQGVEVDCSPCNGGLVKLNRVTNVSYTYEGFLIDAPGGAGGMQVLSNVVTNGTGDCFYLNGVNMTVSGNKGYECGSAYGNGYWIKGIGNTVTGNYVRGAVEDGFHVEGTGHTLTANVADHGNEDGFDVHDATGVTLTSNRSLYNPGSGFEVDGTSSTTTLTGNMVTGVGAIGLCDFGTATTADPAANTFGPVSTGVDCTRTNGFIGN